MKSNKTARVCTVTRSFNTLLVLMTTVLFTIVPLHAKTMIDKGVKAGINFSNMSGHIGRGADASPKVGTLFGGFLTLHLHQKLAIQAELLVSTKGFRREVGMQVFGGRIDFIETAKLTYLEIPILLQLPFPGNKAVRPSLFVGPSLGIGLTGRNQGSYTVSGNTSLSSGSFDGHLGNLKRLDFSIVVGGALGFGARRFTIDVRYAAGLNGVLGTTGEMYSVPRGEIPLFDLEKEQALDLRNNTFSISVGLPLGRR
ncbi:MAG: PorT family protein [candidate division Zixibacteria bacterium]|nr:PorT family protein [candidate division Zixibacteria bacterium]MDH3935942.1 PorT family protein [candidate division Zixibacteria bacterium]MDH4033837.1 PorT family protein [candidate division Zixibacteria bacterium]